MPLVQLSQLSYRLQDGFFKAAWLLDIMRRLIDRTIVWGFPHLEISCSKSKRKIQIFEDFPLPLFKNHEAESPPTFSSPWNSWGFLLAPACQEATCFPLFLSSFSSPTYSPILIFLLFTARYFHIHFNLLQYLLLLDIHLFYSLGHLQNSRFNIKRFIFGYLSPAQLA